MKVCRHDRRDPSPECEFCRTLIAARNRPIEEPIGTPRREHAKVHTYRVIPDVFHRVWVGGKPIPDRFEAYWESWQRHHPRSRFVTWRDEHIAEFGSPCVRLCNECRNPAEMSDVLRFFIVEKYGGIYLDTDFECYRSIDELLDGWDFCSAWENAEMVASAFFAAVPNHPILSRMVEQLRGMSIDHTLSQIKTAGPQAFSTTIGDVYAPGVCIHPTAAFYHQRYEERHTIPPVPTDAYAVHRWSHTWEDWWTTLTICIVDGPTGYATTRESVSGVGAGDCVISDPHQPPRTTHVCYPFAGDRFVADGISKIRKTLRHAPNYAENDFGFPDDQGGTFWVQATKYRGYPPVRVHGEPVIIRGR